MRQTSFADFHCSLARSLEVVGDWWTPLIVRDLAAGLGRFDQLVDDLGISRNLLATRLEALEANGIVRRQQYSARPPRFEYVLTPAGAELVPVLMSLTAWGDRWTRPPDGAPVRFWHRTCGRQFKPRVDCSECGRPVKLGDVVPRPGPGAVAGPGSKLLPEQVRRLWAARGTSRRAG